ncbi:hypothetical protein HDG41_004778 [Paraburkholderia sp. JPY162]|uniref:Uncharacterized protein n=1 Tax=Paraburkholderia youngii TaxID=2782701 RepID=A0A7W8P7B3_9BURK|nr:hypothetical protein [Paraburkholderia youngii]
MRAVEYRAHGPLAGLPFDRSGDAHEVVAYRDEQGARRAGFVGEAVNFAIVEVQQRGPVQQPRRHHTEDVDTA